MVLVIWAPPLGTYIGVPALATQAVGLCLLLLFGIIQECKLSKETRDEKAQMERCWAEEDAKLFGSRPN